MRILSKAGPESSTRLCLTERQFASVPMHDSRCRYGRQVGGNAPERSKACLTGASQHSRSNWKYFAQRSYDNQRNELLARKSGHIECFIDVQFSAFTGLVHFLSPIVDTICCIGKFCCISATTTPFSQRMNEPCRNWEDISRFNQPDLGSQHSPDRLSAEISGQNRIPQVKRLLWCPR